MLAVEWLAQRPHVRAQLRHSWWVLVRRLFRSLGPQRIYHRIHHPACATSAGALHNTTGLR
eukprot:scaffold95368_cov28-Tisochrysis_lutea.AAC.6